MADMNMVGSKVESETDQTVLLVAKALFKKGWPFYSFENMDDKTKYRFIDEAGQLIATLAAMNLVIVEQGSNENAA